MSAGIPERLPDENEFGFVSPWYCSRCGVLTSTPYTLGMLECKYHPHRDMTLRPLPLIAATEEQTKSAGHCDICRATYTGGDKYAINMHCAAHYFRGCTAVDHLRPGENLSAVLFQRPYEVVPAFLFDERFRVCTNGQFINKYRHNSMRVPPILIKSETDIEDDAQTFSAYLEVKIHSPDPIDCGLTAEDAKKYASLIMSLETLYNECSNAYNYAPFKTSNWIRDVLHVNRHILERENETSGGGGMGTMSRDQIFERELYNSAPTDEETTPTRDNDRPALEFFPFYIIMRVEVISARIIYKNN